MATELYSEIEQVLSVLMEHRVEPNPANADPARAVQHGITPEMIQARTADRDAEKDARFKSRHPQAPKPEPDQPAVPAEPVKISREQVAELAKAYGLTAEDIGLKDTKPAQGESTHTAS